MRSHCDCLIIVEVPEGKVPDGEFPDGEVLYGKVLYIREMCCSSCLYCFKF